MDNVAMVVVNTVDGFMSSLGEEGSDEVGCKIHSLSHHRESTRSESDLNGALRQYPWSHWAFWCESKW